MNICLFSNHRATCFANCNLICGMSQGLSPCLANESIFMQNGDQQQWRLVDETWRHVHGVFGPIIFVRTVRSPTVATGTTFHVVRGVARQQKNQILLQRSVAHQQSKECVDMLMWNGIIDSIGANVVAKTNRKGWHMSCGQQVSVLTNRKDGNFCTSRMRPKKHGKQQRCTCMPRPLWVTKYFLAPQTGMAHNEFCVFGLTSQLKLPFTEEITAFSKANGAPLEDRVLVPICRRV